MKTSSEYCVHGRLSECQTCGRPKDDTELQSTVASVFAREPDPNRDGSNLGDLCADIAVLKSELADLSRRLAASKHDSLEVLVSFDCTWGIGTGRHCPDDNPCMSCRFAAARRDRDDYKRQCENFTVVLNDLAENRIPLVEAVRAIGLAAHAAKPGTGEVVDD